MLKKSLLLIASLASWPTMVWADEERWFEVEVYLFERQGTQFEEILETPFTPNKRQPIDMISPLFTTDITGASLGLEGCSAQQWLLTPDECDRQLNQAQISHPSHIPYAIGASEPQYAMPGESSVLLAQSQAQFGDIIAKLRREAGHNSLLHMTWQQSMRPRHQAKPIRVFAGEDFSDRFTQDGYAISATPTPSEIPQFQFELGFDDPTTPKPIWALEGTINIYLNHYLYVETALTLHEAGEKPLPHVAELASTQPQMVPYLYDIWMRQNKRVRSDEIHYFDHPNMGMILQIRKMEQPAERAALSITQEETSQPAQ